MHHGEYANELNQLLPLVRRLAARRLRRWPGHVEEVEQNVLLVLWRRILPAALPLYDPKRGTLSAFLRRPIERAVIDELRRLRAARQTLSVFDHEPELEDADPEDVALADAIRHEPQEFLSPSLLRVFEALQEHATPGDAAAALNMKPKTFYDRAYVLKRKLKDLFRSDSGLELRKAA